MWIIGDFLPVSLVSLKIATATSTGGKGLLWPTPFAVKMALLDVAIRREGAEAGAAAWPAIRDCAVALDGPERICVNNTFTRILKPVRGAAVVDADTGLEPTMTRSIGFREYVQWQGGLRLALQPPDEAAWPWDVWLSSISYLGKRGGFIQASGRIERQEALPESCVLLTLTADTMPLEGTLQLLDDCGPGVTFAQVNVYDGKNLRLGVDRLLRQIVTPYRLARSSRGYSLFERV